MDEYRVLVEGVVRDALKLDGERGTGDLPSEPLTAPEEAAAFCSPREWAEYGDGDSRNPWAQCAARDRARMAAGTYLTLEAGPSSCSE